MGRAGDGCTGDMLSAKIWWTGKNRELHCFRAKRMIGADVSGSAIEEDGKCSCIIQVWIILQKIRRISIYVWMNILYLHSSWSLLRMVIHFDNIKDKKTVIRYSRCRVSESARHTSRSKVWKDGTYGTWCLEVPSMINRENFCSSQVTDGEEWKFENSVTKRKLLAGCGNCPDYFEVDNSQVVDLFTDAVV